MDSITESGPLSTLISFADIMNIKCIMIDANEIDSTHFESVPQRESNIIQFHFGPPDWFPTDKDSQGWIIIHNFNMVQMGVKKPIMKFVSNRKIEDYNLPDGWKIILID